MQKMTLRSSVHVMHILLLLFFIGNSVGEEVEYDEGARRIDLSSSGIKSINLDFSQYPHLEVVDLSNNDIETIESDAFSSNQNLKSINLSGNKGLEITVPFLESTATSLNLSNCNIEKLPDNALDEMENLEVLDLSSNPIKFESSLVFKKNPPKKVIVTTIEEVELKVICKDVDTEIVVLELGKTVQCKDVRKKTQATKAVENGENMETTDGDVQIDIIEEGYIKEDHMEDKKDQMLSDQPMDEGSGDGEEELVEPSSTPKEDVFSKSTSNTEEDLETTTEREEEKDIFSDEAADSVFGVKMMEETTAKEDEVFTVSSTEEKEVALDVVDVDVEKTNGSEAEVDVPASPEKETETVRARASDKTSVKADLVDNPAIGENKVESGSGSNIVLILIVAVVVVGCALVGFRYWKNRKPTYSAVNGENPSDGKELKEIKVVDDKPCCEFVPLVDKTETEEAPELRAMDVIANSRADIPSIDEEVVQQQKEDESKESKE